MKWNMNALQILWDMLKEAGFTHLFTRFLNVDALENLHMKIRFCLGSGDTPNIDRFFDAIKTILLNANVEHTIGLSSSRKANCEADNLFLMSDLKTFLLQDSIDAYILPANNGTDEDEPMDVDDEHPNCSDNMLHAETDIDEAEKKK
jgi:hypothetical protein